MKPTTNNGYDAMRFNNNGGSRIGTIACTTTSTAYNTSSDYRLKENVADMTGAISRVKQLTPNGSSSSQTPTRPSMASSHTRRRRVVPEELLPAAHNEVKSLMDGNAVMQSIDQSQAGAPSDRQHLKERGHRQD